MDGRISRLGTIIPYVTRQLAWGLQGKAYPFAQLHDLAWLASSAKKLPTVPLENLFPSITDLPIELRGSLPKVRGNLTVDELVAVAMLCRWLGPQTVFEFGTFNGRTTLNLAANTPDEAKIYTLDLIAPGKTELKTEKEDGVYHLGEKSGTFFRDSQLQKKIEQLWCDSALFDETFLHGKVDLAFVDGAHSYEYVRSDSAKALAMVRPGGIVLWHDYCAWYPGVYQGLHELSPRHALKHIDGTHLAILYPR
jgi:Methyltransferase domain